MSDPEQYTLRNEEGDERVVTIDPDPEQNNGAMTELISQGYDFVPEESESLIAVLSLDGQGAETVDHVPATNVRSYISEMQRATGRRPLIITGDNQVSEYVSRTRQEQQRAARVRDLSNSWEGVGLGLASGAASLPLAAGQLAGIVDPNPEFLGRPLDEISEARPGMQALGNIATIIGTGGGRLIAGAGVRAAQMAGRAGLGRGTQVLAGLAAEEALWTAGSAVPLQMIQNQPDLSGEAMLAGAGFGAALGYFLGPYRGAVIASRRAEAAGTGGLTQRMIFGGASAGGATPIQRLISDARQPPVHASPVTQVTNPQAEALLDRFPDLPFRSSAEDFSEGIPRYPRIAARARDFMKNLAERRIRRRQATNNFTEEDIRVYDDRVVVDDIMMPADELRQIDDTASASYQRSVDRLDEAVDSLRESEDLLGGTRAANRELLPDSAGQFARTRQGIADIKGNILRVTGEMIERARTTSVTDNALAAVANSLSRGAKTNLIPRRARRGSGLTDIDHAEQLHHDLKVLWQTAGQSSDSGAVQIRQYLSEILSGQRTADELAVMAPRSADGTSMMDFSARAVEPGAIFGQEASERFATVNRALRSVKDEEGAQSILKGLTGTKYLERDPRQLSKILDERQYPDAKSLEDVLNRASDEVDEQATELLDMLGRSDDYVADVAVRQRSSRIHANRNAHNDRIAKSKQSGTSAMGTLAMAQVFGGMVGTVIHPALGWPAGGAAAAASLTLRALDNNPSMFLLQQSRMRNQLTDYAERLGKSQKAVGKSLRSSLRLGARTKGGARLGARQLGFTIFSSGKTRHQRTQEYNALREQIYNMAHDPINVADQLSVSLTPIEVVSPQAAHSMRETTMRALNYLATTIAPPETDPLMISNVSVPPSMAEVDAFSNRLRAIQDPLSIMDDLARGVVSAEASQAVGIVYPRVMGDIQAAIAEELESMGERASGIPYQTRVNIGIMTGAATDITLRGGFIRAMNSRSAQTPQQASAQGLDRMRTRRINVASGFMTKAQSLEEV